MNTQLTADERCINWPCQLPRAHKGPCSTEGKHNTQFDPLPDGHDPDIGPDGICRICGQYEPE